MKPRSRAAAVALLAAVLIISCGSNGENVASTAGGEPSCDDVRSFADRISNVGITYDYEPSDSPAELAANNDVVLAGVLTGGFRAGDPDGLSFVAFEVEVTDVVTGSEHVATGDETFVSLPYNPEAVDAGEFERAIAAGARVVAFAEAADDERELVANLPEGFMTACGDGEPMGMLGEQGSWSSVESLDDVLSRAAGEAPEARVHDG